MNIFGLVQMNQRADRDEGARFNVWGMGGSVAGAPTATAAFV
jgi:hypothetical protein